MTEQPTNPQYRLVLDAPGAEEPYALIDTEAESLDWRYLDTFESEEQARDEYPHLFTPEEN